MKQMTLRPTCVNFEGEEIRVRNYGIYQILTISDHFRVLPGFSLAPDGD
jgi:hypothetical protein